MFMSLCGRGTHLRQGCTTVFIKSVVNSGSKSVHKWQGGELLYFCCLLSCCFSCGLYRNSLHDKSVSGSYLYRTREDRFFFFKAAPNDGSLRFQCSKTQRGCTQGPLHCVVFLLLNHPLNYSLKCLLIKSALLLAVTPTMLAADILYVTSQDVSSVIS